MLDAPSTDDSTSKDMIDGPDGRRGTVGYMILMSNYNDCGGRGKVWEKRVNRDDDVGVNLRPDTSHLQGAVRQVTKG